MMLTKPTRYDRDVAAYQRQIERAAVKRREDAAERTRWSAISASVKYRDGNACRVCHVTTRPWGAGNPALWGQAHHIVYRSAQGTDALSNLVWLCNQCSDDEHTHKIAIAGTSDDLKVTR